MFEPARYNLIAWGRKATDRTPTAPQVVFFQTEVLHNWWGRGGRAVECNGLENRQA
jgi:hypothetical protein